MRVYELPSGEVLDLDKVLRVSELFVCKHDRQYDNYEVYIAGSESINIMENALPRATFLAQWQGV